jgi:hypothetical protein
LDLGTSTSIEQLGGKLVRAGENVIEARKASFRTAEKRMQPRFRDQARAAAGGDRRLSHHRSKAQLDAEFKQVDSATSTFLYINPKGPWRIRDNTDVGGRTDAHTIFPRKRRWLKYRGRDGFIIYARVTHHPGSNRGVYWGKAREESYRYIQRRVPEETIKAITAALNGAGYRTSG